MKKVDRESAGRTHGVMLCVGRYKEERENRSEDILYSEKNLSVKSRGG